MNGLIIREPWIDLILSGSKTWEMRTTPTRCRGPIGLIRKGTGMIVGVADLVDSLAPLDAAKLAVTRHRHCIPCQQDQDVIQARWVHPWVLRNVRRLPRPVFAGQRAGQVIWVPLSIATVASIEEQNGNQAAMLAPEEVL